MRLFRRSENFAKKSWGFDKNEVRFEFDSTVYDKDSRLFLFIKHEATFNNGKKTSSDTVVSKKLVKKEIVNNYEILYYKKTWYSNIDPNLNYIYLQNDLPISNGADSLIFKRDTLGRSEYGIKTRLIRLLTLMNTSFLIKTSF